MRFWPRRRPRPQPPEDVRLTLPDGTVVGPLPLAYEGVVAGGLHRWVAYVDESVLDCEYPAQFRLAASQVPANTELVLATASSETIAQVFLDDAPGDAR